MKLISRKVAAAMATVAIATGSVGGVLAATDSGGATATAATTTTTTTGTPPTKPSGSAPSGSAPGGTSTQTYTAKGTYTVSSGTLTRRNKTYTSTKANTSGVLVKNSAALTLRNAKVRTSGDSKSSDESSFYGLNAGVLANSKGDVTLLGGSVVTTGSGANGVFAYGSGATATIKGTTIKASGAYAHGIMASGGGTVSATNATVSTSGASSAAIATDRGGGTITVSGGTFTTSGYRAPGIYSTGNITVTGATIKATGAEGAVVEGSNSITVKDTSITATKDRGVMLYQSMSGDAESGTGTYTMDGGSLSAAAGPAFYVTNTNAVITLKDGAKVTAVSGVLVRADSDGAAGGTAGAGVVTFTADGETLTGDLIASGSGSSIAATLKDGTKLTGKITNSALTLDASSKWVVTGDSSLTTLTDATTSLSNIVSNGHTITYDSSASANSWLGGKTYSLSGGGTLKPA